MTTPPPSFIFGEYKPSVPHSTRSQSSSDILEQPPPSGMAMSAPPSGMAMSAPPSGMAMSAPPSGMAMSAPPSGMAAPPAIRQYILDSAAVIVTTHGTMVSSYFEALYSISKVDMTVCGTVSLVDDNINIVKMMEDTQRRIHSNLKYRDKLKHFDYAYGYMDIVRGKMIDTRIKDEYEDTKDFMEGKLGEVGKELLKDRVRYDDYEPTLITTIKGYKMRDKIYSMTRDEFMNRTKDDMTVTIIIGGVAVDILDDLVFQKYLCRYTNEKKDSRGNRISFHEMRFSLSGIILFLKDDKYKFLVRKKLLTEAEFKAFDIMTVIDTTCSIFEDKSVTDRDIRRIRANTKKRSETQKKHYDEHSKRSRKRPKKEDDPTHGGNPRRRKSRGRNHRRRKSRRRKSRRRKSLRRKNRGRK